MKVLDILTVDTDEDILSKIAKPVLVEEISTPEFQSLIDNLMATSIKVGGYGLAAPQVGVNRQLFVYRKSMDSNKFGVVINPIIKLSAGKATSISEGCLSVPGLRRNIKRAKTLIVECYDDRSRWIRIKTRTKKEAIVIQHELDHLEGITIDKR